MLGEKTPCELFNLSVEVEQFSFFEYVLRYLGLCSYADGKQPI